MEISSVQPTATINKITPENPNMIDDQIKPLLIFCGISLALLASYIYIFNDKLNFIPISEICSWISSIIIVVFVTNTLFYMVKEGKMIKQTMTIIIYVLMIGCILSSIGSVWNASKTPELKFKYIYK
jgi:hypothetical protein